MAEFRAKLYANKSDKESGKQGHMSVSGTVEAFKALLNGKGQEELEAEVAKELKNLKK